MRKLKDSRAFRVPKSKALASATASMAVARRPAVDFNYFNSRPLPRWVEDVIATHLAIDAKDARSGGMLGFLALSLVVATMPYKYPNAGVFF